jgi:hypothetical protein
VPFIFIVELVSALAVTFCGLAKVEISKHFTVNQAQTLIEAQSLIYPLNRNFWVGAVIGGFFV